MTLPQFEGAPCGHHGPYTFYKSFKYLKNGKYKSLTLGEFFFVRISPSEDPCIGELQLLWDDRNSDQRLSSMRLYFLPEQTPDGRLAHQGEHEVLAASEKVILRLEDLIEWITEEVEWTSGLLALCTDDVSPPPPDPPPEISNGLPEEKKEPDKAEDTEATLKVEDVSAPPLESESSVDVPPASSPAGEPIDNDISESKEVKKENEVEDDKDLDAPAVIVVPYNRYCRYRSILKRLDGMAKLWLRNALVVALGGFTLSGRNTRILFCRETFDNEALAHNDLNCEHLAPNLKGRPRKKHAKNKRSLSPSSESNASEESRDPGKATKTLKNGLKKPSCKYEQEFLQKLFKFMKTRNTPIHRVPHLGFKQIDLYFFYTYAQKLGGYDTITCKKLWKHVYDEMGGNPGSTSAATCTRRHYERLLLPFERFMAGEEDKPLPIIQTHRIKTKKMKSNSEVNNGIHSSTKDEEEDGIDKDNVLKEGMHDEEDEEEEEEVEEEVEEEEEGDYNDEDIMSDDALASNLIVKEIMSKDEDSLTLTVKLEKLPSLDKQNENQENWQTVHQKKMIGPPGAVLSEKEHKWNEIRKKNALARCWARQLRSTKSPHEEQKPLSQHQQLLQQKPPFIKKEIEFQTSSSFCSDTTKHSLLPGEKKVSIKGYQLTSSDAAVTTESSGYPAVYSTCADRPLTSTVGYLSTASCNAPVSYMDNHSAKPYLHKIEKKYPFPEGMSASNLNAIGRNSPFTTASATVTSVNRHMDRHNLIAGNPPHFVPSKVKSEIKDEHGTKVHSRQMSSAWVPRTQSLPVGGYNFNVTSSWNGDNRQSIHSQKSDHSTVIPLSRINESSTMLADKESKPNILTGHERVSQRRPSVILHTEQMRSPPQSSSFSSSTVKTENTNQPLASQAHTSITADERFLHTLDHRQNRLGEVGMGKMNGSSIRRMLDPSYSKSIDVGSKAANMIAEKPHLMQSISSMRIRDHISRRTNEFMYNKISHIENSRGVDLASHKIEDIPNRSVHMVENLQAHQPPLSAYRHHKRMGSSLSSSHSGSNVCVSSHTTSTSDHKLIHSLAGVRNNMLGNCKESYYDQPKRPKHSASTPILKPLLRTPSVSSKPSALSYCATSHVEFPKVPVPSYSYNSCEDIEVLDLSVKKKPQVEVNGKTMPTPALLVTDVSADGECLDLSIKKKPLMDSSALPSGIENITPPPPTSEDSVCLPVTSLTGASLTPLGSTKFFNDLTTDRLTDSKSSSPHLISILDSKLSSSSSSLSSQEQSGGQMYTQLPYTVKGAAKSVCVTDYTPHLPNFLAHQFHPPNSQIWTSNVNPPTHHPSTRPSSPSYKELADQRVFPDCHSQSFPPHLYPYLYNDGHFYSAYSK